MKQSHQPRKETPKAGAKTGAKSMPDYEGSALNAALHPRDQFITIFGRKAVFEALQDPSIEFDKIIIDRAARGEFLEDIKQAALQRCENLKYADARAVTRISKNGRQDQGVVADICAPRMQTAEAFFAELGTDAPAQLIAIDNVTTPANVGLIIRSAVGAGMTGIILPRTGTSSINPLVIKASAGLIFRARLIRCETLETALQLGTKAGFDIVSLEGDAKENLFDAQLKPRSIYVMGNETDGVSDATKKLATRTISIPMADGVESLNVAVSASLVCFEARRKKMVR